MAGSRHEWHSGAHDDGDVGLPQSPAFRMLTDVFGDREMADIWSERHTVQTWLQFEGALADAQSRLGVIPVEAADAIRQVCSRPDDIDLDLLHDRMRIVGYPILPLLEQLGRRGGEQVDRFVHWGATTQDVMDTGLALQSVIAIDRILELLRQLGDALCELALRERDTLMVARTHGQPAVPTTLGAVIAVLLSEFTRHHERMVRARGEIGVLSMFGAGGSSDAYGPDVIDIRVHVGALLGLQPRTVPWHTARDALAETIWDCVSITATSAKIGTEVIELSRPEIGELREGSSRLRGASSTMPQKVNPISSEVLIGLAGSVLGAPSAAATAMRAGHQRAAGEWQIEWDLFPHSFCAAASSLATAVELVNNVQVDRVRMLANLHSDNGLIMAEAAMMQLAPLLGRHAAHELVYDSCADVRDHGVSLKQALTVRLGERSIDTDRLDLEPAHHIGGASASVDAAVVGWAERKERA